MGPIGDLVGYIMPTLVTDHTIATSIHCDCETHAVKQPYLI